MKCSGEDLLHHEFLHCAKLISCEFNDSEIASVKIFTSQIVYVSVIAEIRWA